MIFRLLLNLYLVYFHVRAYLDLCVTLFAQLSRCHVDVHVVDRGAFV